MPVDLDLAEAGIDRHEHGADAHEGVHGHDEAWAVRGENADMLPVRDAAFAQGADGIVDKVI